MVRPFSTHRPTEIVAAPKVYGFDTGFVCYYRGWHNLRPDDLGHLWEHFVLNEVQAIHQIRGLQYWRDKRGHEVDFVVASRSRPPLAIECKWSADDFDPSAILAFRRQYPEGDNCVVAHDVDRSYRRKHSGVDVRYVSLSSLIRRLA